MFYTINSPAFLRAEYYPGEETGVIIIIAASGVSLVAAIFFFISLAVIRFRAGNVSTADTLFMQSHLGIYFVSFVIAHTIIAVGSFLNIKWVADHGITSDDPLCITQGIMKNVGNVATALWNLVISLHIFNLLFLRHTPQRLLSTLVTLSIWCAVGAISIAGPAVIQKQEFGPYFTIAGLQIFYVISCHRPLILHAFLGYWCWISDKYGGARIGLEFFWMFFSAFTTLLLHTLTYFRLRGNIIVEGWRVRFRWISGAKAWKLQEVRDHVDTYMTTVALQMIWLPVSYGIFFMPIAISRFVQSSSRSVPFPGWYSRTRCLCCQDS
ncbi:uncharacterized protein EI90DRAFT_671884 [Cantharellus anzutake]|uniref:uncharacterized protein n=1 Tax=Cantharellus anzutake TaxID=1750568 RepID=UPI001904FD30|nr:uncharacterized protein EI90DRAFT_671884 [Cantharellus anzutake]KAF8332588.1 hypothetical protein EI90DRAFT_671884 [Cantharellus anzutake]